MPERMANAANAPESLSRIMNAAHTLPLQEPIPAADQDIIPHSHPSLSLPSVHGHNELLRHNHEHDGSLRREYRKEVDGEADNISMMQANSKHADMTVAPFLSEHIPLQYNPIAGPEPSSSRFDKKQHEINTKFCYRHRPDLKCKRQANEPSMDQLQNELASLSQSDQQAISHVWSLFSAAPAKHRNLMLQGVLTQCCFPQLSFISAQIKDLIKIDFLSALPPELGFKILCYLDTTSLCKAAQVSQRWRELADDDVVWHKMCEQHIDRKCEKCGWGLPLLERKRLRIEKRQIQLRASGRGINEWSPNITPIPEDIPQQAMIAESSSNAGTKRPLDEGSQSPEFKRHCSISSQGDTAGVPGNDAYFAPRKRPWKDVYKDRFKVGTAWKHGRCSTKVFKGHTNGVMCVQFDENTMITGSYDTTIKVWDIGTGECIRTMKGHTSGIRCLQFDKNKLMTGSLDSTLKLWNWRTGELLRTFPAHNDGIITLHFTPRYVATGSRDKTIRVFDSQEKMTRLLTGHKDWVNCVRVDEPSRTLFSASDDLSVRLWDLDTGECIRTFEGHVGQVQQVVPMPVEFELDDHRRTPSDKDDDASSVSSVTIAPSHQAIVQGTSHPTDPFWPNDADRPAPPRYMLTGALDSTIRLWDTHYRPSKRRAETPQDLQHSDFEIIPTDPLTNSHMPRAQACVRTFFGHVEGIWALAADHLRLISGSEDCMMKIWDPRTGKCERTFTGHQGPVTCAWLSDSRIASGSEDCEVRMLCFGEAD